MFAADPESGGERSHAGPGSDLIWNLRRQLHARRERECCRCSRRDQSYLMFFHDSGGGAVDGGTGFPSAVLGSINSMRVHPDQRGSLGVSR